MGIRKNIYLNDEEVIKHLEKQQNQSKYIENLILKDMMNESELITKAEVIELIESYIKKLPKQNKNKDVTKNSLDGLLGAFK